LNKYIKILLLFLLFCSSANAATLDPLGIDTTTGQPKRWQTGDTLNGVVFSGPALQVSVNQATHGFSVLNVVINNAGTWQLATATNGFDGCRAPYVVTSVEDTNNFTATRNGIVTLASHGLAGASNQVYTSVQVDDILWQSGNTIRADHNGGAKDLSMVAAGHYLRIVLEGGADGAYSNMAGVYRITAVNDASDYFDYYNPHVTSNVYNLSAMTDSENVYFVYGAAKPGDILYLSEEDGKLSPFPANGHHVELPILTVIDSNTVYILGSVPSRTVQPKVLVDKVNQMTPNDGDDDYEFLGIERINFKNPQNHNLHITFWSEDGSSGLDFDIDGVTHQGGEYWTWTNDTGTMTITNTTNRGTRSQAAISATQEAFPLAHITGTGHKIGEADFYYDSVTRRLVFKTSAYSTATHYFGMKVLEQVDLSSAVLKDVGNTNLDFFDLTITRR